MNHRRTAGRGFQNLSLLVLAAVAACQPATPQAKVTVPTAAAPRATRAAQSLLRPVIPAESLRGVGIQIWYPWFGVEAGLLESQVADFNQENEWGITVTATGQTSFTELFNNVKSVLPGSEAPQLVIALPEYPIGWDAAGHVVDLTPYVDDPVYGLGSEEIGDIPTVFWNQEVVAGRRLGVPAQRSAHFLTYNQSWARELGFPSAPASETEFRKQACSAHASLARDDDARNDGQGGWLIDTDSMTFLSWMVAFGGGVLDGDGYRFLTPKNLEAATYVKQLYDDACAWVPPESDDHAGAFADRRALFATAGLGELSGFGRAMAAAGNKDTWTVISFPGPVQEGLVAYGSSFVVLKSTPEQQLASWLFIRWMLSAEIQKPWVEATGLFPLRTSAMDSLGSYAKSHPQWTAAMKYVAEAQIQPQLASWREVRVMLGDGFDAMFRSNTPAGRVAEILAIMDRTARDLSP